MMRLTRAGFSSVQDLGRAAPGASGVPRGGAFDEWALRRGNRLCGNEPDAAGIEFVLAGPEVVFEKAALVAITGAPFAATLDGAAVEGEIAVPVAAGATLSIGKAARGARGYLCVAGGIATEPVLASRSASPRAGIGLMLAGGDRLPAGTASRGGPERPRPNRPETPDATPDAIRVVAGPSDLAEDSLERLIEEEWTVTPDADRVGVRLDGPALAHGPGGPEIDPEPAMPGVIQVPGDGRPIVLGPDGPATGGYPKIATVIRADLWVLAQARPGDRLRFRLCDPAAARAALAEQAGRTDA
ncbi:MAG TPA: biotin-dependent carboxyltransferase family protein [Actinomycetota bacterium]|nr:biotin-dependent carboxyltransferase family protein [Actinomycetota bacterium]